LILLDNIKKVGRSVARCPKLCFNNPYIATISNNQITQIIE